MLVFRHSNHTTLCISFFALSSTAGCLLSGLRQPSHPARIFSGILLDPFYLLPARRQPAHVTLVLLQYFCVTGDGKTLREVTVEIVLISPRHKIYLDAKS